MTRRLDEMTHAEAGAAIARGAVLIIPAGAMEQHGPAMPLGTDTLRAAKVAADVAELMVDDVVIGPTIPVGVSPHHLAFPGTMSLRPSTFALVLREYIDSLAQHGWRRVLVITGHGGNNSALGTVAQDVLRDHPAVEFAWTPVTALAKSTVAQLGVSEVHGHCGEAETAQMLHVAHHLVRRQLLEAGSTTLDDLDPLARLAREAGQPTMAFPYDRLSANGVLGDPRNVTEADGAAIIAAVVSRITAFIREWLTT